MRTGVLALLLVVPATAGALDTELSARAAFWSSSRMLDDEDALAPVQLWLRTSAAATFENLTLRTRLEGWGELQATGAEERYDGKLREAYVQLSTGPLELRGGWQIIAWGRTDGINPTDHLTPRQLTFLTRDTDDQRFGVPALRAAWYAGPVSLSAIWLAGFEPSEIPLPPAAAALSRQEPENEAGQWAARLDLTTGAVEGSLSVFEGYEVLPSQVVLAATPGRGATMHHDRIRTIGGDVATTVGRLGLRAEVAYSDSPRERQAAVFARQAQWYLVAGGDRTFGEYLNVNLQYYVRRVEESAVRPASDPVARRFGSVFAIAAQQFDRIDRGFTFRVSHKWLNETLEANVSGLVSTARHGYLLRPLLTYRATDQWTLSVGAELFEGSATSPWGLLQDNSAVHAEVRWGF